MIHTCLASVTIGQIVGYLVIAVLSAFAAAAAWVLNDGRKFRCPRCGASTWRFAQRCGRCRREVTPYTAEKVRKIRERQLLAAELSFVGVFILGCLVLWHGSGPAPAPARARVATAARPLPSLAPLPGTQAPTVALAGDPWPIANELPPADASPRYRNWVDASKKRAVEEHPALGVPGSAFQNALIARYRELSHERNGRLNDPRWPEELATEVALQLSDHPARPAHP